MCMFMCMQAYIKDINASYPRGASKVQHRCVRPG